MEITQINPFTQPEVIKQIATVYQAAFGGAPWYETWALETIISDFTSEMKKPGAICVVAEVKNRIIGFAWGYTVTPSKDLDEHLDAPDAHKNLAGDYFYLDECAVTPVFHGRGIGKRLVQTIFATQQHKEVLLRTKDGSRMCNLITQMGGIIIQYISEERVIMRVTLA